MAKIAKDNIEAFYRGAKVGGAPSVRDRGRRVGMDRGQVACSGKQGAAMKITFRQERKPQVGCYGSRHTVNVRVDGETVGVLQEEFENIWRVWILAPDPNTVDGKCWSMVNGHCPSEADARAMFRKLLAEDPPRVAIGG